MHPCQPVSAPLKSFRKCWRSRMRKAVCRRITAVESNWLGASFLYNRIAMPKYSIVVPFHNEEENVTTLYDRLKAVMESVGDSFELVLVDDGSNDRSYKLLEEIAA